MKQKESETYKEYRSRVNEYAKKRYALKKDARLKIRKEKDALLGNKKAKCCGCGSTLPLLLKNIAPETRGKIKCKECHRKRKRETSNARRAKRIAEREASLVGKRAICKTCGKETERFLLDMHPIVRTRTNCESCNKKMKKKSDTICYKRKRERFKTDLDYRKHLAEYSRMQKRREQKRMGKEVYNARQLEKAHEWREKNPEKYRELCDMVNARRRDAWHNDTTGELHERHRKYCKQFYKRNKVRNPDKYIRLQAEWFFRNGTDLKAKDIPKELIDAKLIQIKNYRLLHGRSLTIKDRCNHEKSKKVQGTA